ncbi:MAG: lysophospholipid acyltransferase family protein [Gammaproteobacteria bacterium]
MSALRPAKTPRRRPPGFFGGEARSDSSDRRVALSSFLTPRYWRSWLLIGWLRLAALLPWRWSLSLHRWLGRKLGQSSRKSVRMVGDNLERCFPEMTGAERTRLADDYFGNMGAIVAELALAWFRSPDRVRAIIEIEGREHLEQALAGGCGVILFLGHFTTIEMCGVGVGACAPHFVITHNARRSRLLSEFQRRSRERLGDEVLTKHQGRALIRSLRDNAVVWFAGDEAYTGRHSALIPFFGEPAPTSTALSRLARISGAAVVPLFYQRKADDSGYLLRFSPALEGFPGDDATADTRRLVEILEQQIRECPEQYFWKQKRFRELPPTRPEPNAA